MVKRNVIVMLTSILSVYFFLSVYRMEGLMVYVGPIALWASVALIALWICRSDGAKLHSNGSIILIALLTGIMQVSALMFAALFGGFGRSPYLFTPSAILMNVAYFTSPLVAFELSRSYLINSCSRRALRWVILLSLLYSMISIPIARFFALTDVARAIEFVGSRMIPTLAQNLLATYLVLLSGPLASIAYLGTIEAFEWLCPILPRLSWPIEALITTLTPLMGIILLNQSVSPLILMSRGLMSRDELTLKLRRGERSSAGSLLIVTLVALILMWSTTGLLGFQLSVVASGSMRPTIDAGDVIVTVATTADRVNVGDVVMYWRSGDPAPIVHRVVDKGWAGGAITIVTKGDANSALDEPIVLTPMQKVGKLIFVVPKIGWISIYMKMAVTTLIAYLTENHVAMYMVVIAIIAITVVSAIGVHKLINKSRMMVRGYE